MFILIKKIEPSLRINPRNVPLLDMELMILAIAYGIMRVTKSLGVKIIFNEKVMHKDQLQRKKEEKESKEYTVLDDEIPKVPGN